MRVSVSEAGEITMSDGKDPTNSAEEETELVIDEVITFKPAEAEAKYNRAEFAAVVFQNIAEVYPVDAHIECKYTITADIVPTTRDWVALYRVGWVNPTRDYVYYEWAPMPKGVEVGKENEASILFPSHKLPDDDGEFYQFCYVSSSGQIRGASTPFQFRKPSSNDYVEVDDPDVDMLVIQSRSVYLQENLQAAESQKNRLMEEQGNLQRERDRLVSLLNESQEKLSTSESQTDEMKNKLAEKKTIISRLNKEADDMFMIQDELRTKTEALVKEKEALEKKIDDLNQEIAALTSGMKKLQSEKDDLEGQKKALLDQVSMYKEHFTTSEGAAALYSKKSEDMQVQIAEKESLLTHLRETVDKLTRELESERQNFDSQAILCVKDREKIEELEEKLRNAEDKLSAAEESRSLATQELKTYKEIHAQLTSDIEKTKSENHCLKTKLSELEKDFQKKSEITEMELETTLRDLQQAMQDKEIAQMKNISLKEQLEMSSLQSESSMSSSMSVMKQTLTQLKERLEKKEKQTRSLERALNTREKEFVQHESDLMREIDDLKEKIYMCSEEYKSLLKDKSKLQKKFEKISEKKKAIKIQRVQSEEIQIEKLQTSGAASAVMTDSLTKPKSSRQVPPTKEEEDVQSNFSNDEIQQQMEDFERQLNLGMEKKLKYKKLYQDEKTRNEEMQNKMEDLLQQKDEEVKRLHKRIRDMPGEWDCKLRSLEKCVTEKEAVIEMLNKKLRDSANNDDVFKAAASSPTKTAASSSGPDSNETDRPSKTDVDDVTDGIEFLNLTPAEMVVPSAPPAQEDRFLDAPGEPMKLCPVCNKSFPIDIPDQDFENHCMDHVEGICPVCRMMRNEHMSNDDFMRHVNKHYDDENETF